MRAPFAACHAKGDLITYTVGMYSPGKAFVVYEMRRHVFHLTRQRIALSCMDRAQRNMVPYLADSTITCDDALYGRNM